MKFVAAVVAALIGFTALAPSSAESLRQPLVGRSFAPPGPPGDAPPSPPGPGPTRESGYDRTPDAEPGAKQTHLIYFVPRDREDEALDTNGTLTRSADGMRDWFARETSRNGRRALRPRLDRIAGSNAYDITFVVGNQNADRYTSIDVISRELSDRGFSQPNKRYLVFAAVARGNICGEGYYPVPSVIEARYSVVYLDSNTACGSRDFGNGTAASAGKAETVAAHEWLHNEGVVSPGAPHHCWIPPYAYHVCTGPLVLIPGDVDPEYSDVAFPFMNLQLRHKILDRGFDDYLDHQHLHVANLRDSVWFE